MSDFNRKRISSHQNQMKDKVHQRRIGTANPVNRAHKITLQRTNSNIKDNILQSRKTITDKWIEIDHK
jgi:hypothetical protein